MAGTGLFTAVSSTLWVALTDAGSSEAMLARCSGAAPTTANTFAEGCLMIRIDNGKLYSNTGTAAVPVWDSVSDVTNSEITAPKIGVITQTVGVAEFTDGGGASGTLDLSTDIPAGAIVTQSMISAVTGFAGDTSAVITIGDGSDVDRYNTGTPDVFTTAAHISAGVVSGTAYDLTAQTPTITVTSASAFADVVTDGNGEMTITIFYYTVV